MYQDNTTGVIYCNNKHDDLIKYVKKHHTNILLLYDAIDSSIIYDMPRFHYTEINNAGYSIYIDDLRLFDRLKDKNNTIIYYLTDKSDHNMNYNKIYGLMESVDAILVHDPKAEKDLIRTVFKYTKELFYV